MAVKPIPDGFHTVTPYLVLEGAAKFIDFAQQAFGATADERINRPDGGVMHAQLKIGDSMVMLADSGMQWKPFPASIYLYVPNPDEVYQRAIRAGATSVMEPSDMFWGDRHGCVKDSWGNQWSIATHIEDMSLPELQKRAEEFMKQPR